MRFKDKVVIVTGSGQGIGRVYAHCFGQEGGKIVVAEINAEKGRAVVDELEKEQIPATFVHANVADEQSCKAMADAAVREFGRIDVLVNNAAIFSTIKMKKFWDLTQDEWDQLMAVNVRGVWLASKAVLPVMQAQNYGRIINISSGVIWMGRQDYLHYVASKGAVFAMTRAMAREAAPFGITVNCVTPGPTYTEIPRETVTPEQKIAMVNAQLVKRPEEPNDLAGAVAFLASDDAAFITGQTLTVDGGLNFH
jgi:3-oxoacyl-[acyl-carrier protein] reductase